MIEDIRTVNREDRVKSEDNRELDDRIYSTLSSEHHNLLRLLGRVRTMSTSLTLTNASLSSLLDSETADENTVLINSNTEPTYPSSITEAEMAERDIIPRSVEFALEGLAV